MPRSRNKYSRARIRARVRRPKKRGGANWFYGVLAAIFAVGSYAVYQTTGDTDSSNDIRPRPTNSATGQVGDHWHEAFGVNVCGEWLDDPAEFTTVHDNPNVYAGLHTHADGFLHVEPASLSESGNNATFGRFLDYAGWRYDGESLDVWQGPATDPTKTEWTNGEECPPGSQYAGQQGSVKWELNCDARDADPNRHKLRDLEVITIGFVPEGEALGAPPSADSAPESEGGSSFGDFEAKGCRTAGPGGTTTTTAAEAVTTTTSTP